MNSNNSREIIIGYVEDDAGGQIIEVNKLHDAFEKYKRMNEYKYSIEIIDFNDKNNTKDFFTTIINSDFKGMIMDYNLMQSNLFADASEIWQPVKRQNPLYPLSIITSHPLSAVELVGEKIFSKSDDNANLESYKELVEYMEDQIERNIKNTNGIKKAISGLKNDESISWDVLEFESMIESSSLFPIKEQSNSVKLDKLLEEAIEIISKYSRKGE